MKRLSSIPFITSLILITVIVGGQSTDVPFANDVLQVHNNYRNKHQAPPLTINQSVYNFYIFFTYIVQSSSIYCHLLFIQLNGIAQKWAQNLADTGIFQHSGADAVGENLYASFGMEVNGKTVVDSWYNEIQDYDFSSPGFSSNTGKNTIHQIMKNCLLIYQFCISGHFTQLVWVGSTQLGIGKTTSTDGTTYVVANYLPPGNFEGEFQVNVLQQLQ